jgi:hypothetical protein
MHPSALPAGDALFRHAPHPSVGAPSPAAQTPKRAQQIAATLRSKSTKRTWSASRLPLLLYTKSVLAKGLATFLYVGQASVHTIF